MSCVEVVSRHSVREKRNPHFQNKRSLLQYSNFQSFLRPFVHQDAEEEVSFPNLPPLLRGHSGIHLRNGVMRASRLAALHEVDAEKAFFVADLSFVYKQHAKWMRHLPYIEPFYGMFVVRK